MAIVVRELFKNGEFLYKMKLIAGKSGMSNLVKWVHIIEDAAAGAFLHGGELVFTAGILNRQQDWMLQFVHHLHEADASAFVVNIGPYTQDIPEAVAAYCDAVELPLFTIPWETRMVDMTRDFCYRIMKNDNRESNMAAVVKNMVLKGADPRTSVVQMEQYGCDGLSRFCFLCIGAEGRGADRPEFRSVLEGMAEQTAKTIRELYVSFQYRDCFVPVLIDYTDEEIRLFAERFVRRVQTAGIEGMYMGVGPNRAGFTDQTQNFEKALHTMQMARKRRETCSYYDKLGVYRILYAVNDPTVLRGFYKETIGRLEQYDHANKTQLAELLRTYLTQNGSLQLTSEKMYLHRNTVTNQLKKIEKITGYDPLEVADRVKLYLGFAIQEML